MTSNVAIAEPATIGIPRCVNSDHTINALSDNVDVIDEYGWRAVTSWFLSNVPISVGDILTPEPGVSVTGDYGKLKKAVVGEIGVAVAVAIGSGWLQYLAIEPRIVGGPLPRLHASTHHSGGSDELRLDQLAAPVGSLDMNKQQAVSLCVENRTSDPSSPGIGQIWLRTDL
jgi:hypothetical protein